MAVALKVCGIYFVCLHKASEASESGDIKGYGFVRGLCNVRAGEIKVRKTLAV